MAPFRKLTASPVSRACILAYVGNTHSKAPRHSGGSPKTSILLKLSAIDKIYKMKRKHLLVLNILQCLSTRVSSIALKSELRKLAVEDAILLAAKNGNYEFIFIMARENPELLFVQDSNNRNIFSHAILNRHEKVFNIVLNNIGGDDAKEILTSGVDVFKNNMVHLAAELGPSSHLGRISNPALRLQRELKWFKEVKNIVPRWCSSALNKEDQLPDDIFTKSHDKLLKDAQQWAKDASSSFTTVGTLIITIMFAAAFTIPGGTKENNGTPIFLGKSLFNLFIIADAISLVTSASSLLIFIGIATSRYDVEDFYTRFPLKLLCGLLTLFFSMASMMAAFCAALALLLHGYHQIVIAAMWLALLPIMVFVPSLVSLFIQILTSTMTSVIKYR